MSISDVLFKAVNGLDHYLNDQFYDDWYEGEFRERIIKLRNEAEEIVRILDTPPQEPGTYIKFDTNEDGSINIFKVDVPPKDAEEEKED